MNNQRGGKRSALIHQNPIIFTPDLARLIGVNCAIVIQKLEFLLDLPDTGREIDGVKWIYNTYAEWSVKYFPFWSVDTIERAFLALEKSSFVCSCQPDGRQSRRKCYRVSDSGYALLTTNSLPDDRNLPPSEDRNLPPSLYTENTTENTTPTPSDDHELHLKLNLEESIHSKQSEKAGGRRAKPQPPIVPADPPSPSRSLAKARYRLCQMWGRKTSLAWSKKEDALLPNVAATDEEDWLALEAYYKHWGEDGFYCRKNLITLLNNWASEIDKAKAWAKSGTSDNEIEKAMRGFCG